MDWDSDTLFCFNDTIQSKQGLKLFTRVDHDGSTLFNPLLITVQYGIELMSWTLPYVSRSDNPVEVYEVDRTLCLLEEDQNNFDIAINVISSKCKTKSIVKVWECCWKGKVLNVNVKTKNSACKQSI